MKQYSNSIFFILVFLFINCSNTATEAKKPAKDLDAFINDFREVINRKDTGELKRLLSNSVKTLCDNTGKDAFFNYWKLTKDYENSPFWLVMQRLLKQDYHKTDENSYYFPKSMLLKTDVKSPYYVFENTTLYKDSLAKDQLKTIDKSSIISVNKLSKFNQKVFLNEDLSFVVEGCKNCLFEVVLKSGEKGYVKSSHIWSIDDGIFVIFQRDGSEWKINSVLIEG